MSKRRLAERIVEEVVLPHRLIRVIDQNRGRLTRAEFIDLCVSSFIRSKPQFRLGLKVKPTPPIEMPNRYSGWLWLSTLLTYGVGDVLASHLVIQAGLLGANPILSTLGNILALIFFKLSTIIAFFLLSYLFRNHKTLYYLIPVAVTVVGIILILHNMLLLS